MVGLYNLPQPNPLNLLCLHWIFRSVEDRGIPTKIARILVGEERPQVGIERWHRVLSVLEWTKRETALWKSDPLLHIKNTIISQRCSVGVGSSSSSRSQVGMEVLAGAEVEA